MLPIIHLLLLSFTEGGKSSAVLGRHIKFMWVKRGCSEELPFLQTWSKSRFLKFWPACGGRARFKVDLFYFMKQQHDRVPRGTSAHPWALQWVGFPEQLARTVLHISQKTHTALKGRNSWFSSNCLARKKQEAISQTQQQSALQSPRQRQ